jgi:hypothetical protein
MRPEAENPDMDPDWDTPLTLTLTPAAIIDTVFGTAESVHTGDESCVDQSLVVNETTAIDDQSENYCRFVEQEYVEEAEPDATWHDWAVEIRIDKVMVAGHWRAPVNGSPSDWEWCAVEAEKAFAAACVLVGKRVRRGIVIDQSSAAPRPSRTHH